MQINGLLFDKDGTIFSYSRTWDTWCAMIIEKLSQENNLLAQKLADAIGFDLATKKILPHSIVIAGTNLELAIHLSKILPDWLPNSLEQFLNKLVVDTPLAEVTPLKEYFATLRNYGLKLGVMTNDSENNAFNQLEKAQVDAKLDLDFVAGYDTGFGAKPSPAPLLAFSQAVDITPSEIAMVGDSMYDLIAGRRAGMKTIGVLTGFAVKNDLIKHADHVLPDISHILKILHKLET